MSKSSQHARKKMSVLEWMAFILLSLVGLFVAAMAMAAVYVFYFPESAGKQLRPTQVLDVIKDLRIAIAAYEVEYNRLPSPEPGPHGQDISVRSQGPILTALLGKEASELNPRPIRFFDGPFDSDRKFALSKDGNEWVLRDRWGELYYLILDTNEDKQITNPEFGADQSNPRYAAKCRNIPPPPTLPVSVIVYSSGPDRDPKTWHDNICSWRD